MLVVSKTEEGIVTAGVATLGLATETTTFGLTTVVAFGLATETTTLDLTTGITVLDLMDLDTTVFFTATLVTATIVFLLTKGTALVSCNPLACVFLPEFR